MMTRVRMDQFQARVNGNPMFVFSNDMEEVIVNDIAGFICLLPESKIKIRAIQGRSQFWTLSPWTDGGEIAIRQYLTDGGRRGNPGNAALKIHPPRPLLFRDNLEGEGNEYVNNLK